MAYIKQLKLNNEDICPLTHESAVVDSNGTNLSSKINNMATKDYVTTKITEASIGGGDIDLTGYAKTEDIAPAVESYVQANKSTLKGDKGDKGEQGIQGEKGDKGDKGTDGLTTQIKVNGSTYTQNSGLITLPNCPSVPTKTSQLTNDSNFLTQHQSLANYYKKTETYSKSEVDTKTSEVLKEITEQQYSRNKWSYGDITITESAGYKSIDVEIPTGNYMLSLELTSTDTDNTHSQISLVDENDTYIRQLSVARNERWVASLNIDRPVKQIRFYSGYNAPQSAGDTATFKRIQLEEGTVVTDYVPYGKVNEEGIKALAKSENSLSLFNIFTLPLYHHLNQELTTVGIPAQSLYDIQYAKSLGFNMIEVNEQLCSDGVYVCKHGSNGALGKGIKAINNNDYSNTLFSSVTSAWLRENIRYDSTIAKYCGFIPTLDEFCKECKKLNMAIKISKTATLAIARKYLPDHMIWISGISSRGDFRGTIEYIWDNAEPIDTAIENCKKIGAPLNIVIKSGQFDNTTDALVSELCTKAHNNGFTVGAVYPTPNSLLRAFELGVDVVGSTGNNVNLITNGNAKNITSLNSSELTLSNATYNNATDTMTIASGGSITVNDNGFKSGVVTARLRYKGKLTINDGVFTGYGLKEYESDGEKEVQYSIAIQPLSNNNKTKWLVITANTATTIYDMSIYCSYINSEHSEVDNIIERVIDALPIYNGEVV
jgi:hypothetical protein